MNDLVLLIDGNSLMYRAFHATAYSGNLMKTSAGLYTNAVYGFINLLNKILENYQPSHILVAFDKGKKTFRHKMYDAYKATRSQMPAEMVIQIPLIKEFVDLLGIKQIELDEYEADDIIGSMAKKTKAAKMPTIILSGDKDLLQLVDENVTVCLTKKGISELDEYTQENFFEKLGHTPKQIIDYKALTGDASDNIPGVKGIGPKTALTLLTKYSDLSTIYEQLDNISGKTKELLVTYHDEAHKSYQLATIYQDIEYLGDLSQLKYQNPSIHKLRLYYEKLEFNSLIKRMHATSDEVVNNYPCFYHDLVALKKAFTLEREVYIEIELDQDNYHKADILGLGFFIDGSGYFIDKNELHDDDIRNFLSSEYPKIVIDSKKMLVSLKYHGFELNNIVYDLMLATYIINPQYVSSDIKNICEQFGRVTLPYHEEIYGKKNNYIVAEELKYAKYCLDKLGALCNIKAETLNILNSHEQLNLLTEMEIPLAYVLSDMEHTGFKIDKKRLGEIGKNFEEKIIQLELDIHRLCGEEFNINSPKQLGVILFEKMNLGRGKKNKTGYQTGADILEALKESHPVINLILDYRKYTKLYNTYVTGLFNVINPVDSKVHTIFKQYLTLTGRLSSVEPNIQNIPVKDDEGKLIRSAFISRHENGVLVSADYSQIELRVLASMAGASDMINDFNEGMDLHSATAAKIYDIPYSEVTSEMRRSAKAINFGIVYGMSDWGLSENLNISVSSAHEFIEKYFSIYPQIKTYLDKIITDAHLDGYTKTYFGRRRYINELQSSNVALKKFGERTAMNAPIQGTAADIIKIAMVKLYQRLKKENLKSQIVAQVHDELVIDTVSDEIDIIKLIVKEEMEQAVTMDVKFRVDVEVGTNWNL